MVAVIENNLDAAKALRVVGRRMASHMHTDLLNRGYIPAPSSEGRWRDVGRELWPCSYAHTQDDLQAWGLLAEELVARGVPAPLVNTEVFSGLAHTARWYDCAWPTVELSREHAAALMATSIPDQEIEPPWPAFLLRVPPRLLYMTDGARDVEISAAYVGRYAIQQKLLWYIALHSTHSPLVLFRDRLPFSNLLEHQGGVEVFDERERRSSLDERTMDMAVRLVINFCQALSEPSASGELCHYSSGLRRPCDGSEALRKTFKWLPPVKVKCADAIRDWCRTGIGTPRTVRWLTRGHWRNQACGPGLSERRATWIEPYWNNVSSEIVATRKHVVGTP